jgi:hypothetical protein
VTRRDGVVGHDVFATRDGWNDFSVSRRIGCFVERYKTMCLYQFYRITWVE